jgi:phenylacetate-CoA ligase
MSIFHTHLLLPLAEPERHAGLARRMREIRRFERMSEKQQRAVQQYRLQCILAHAYNTVPFYRRRFDDAGFRPLDARVNRPLPLPVLKRDDLREGGESLRSNIYPLKDLRQAGSSGTTSTPIQFYRNIEALRDKSALQFQLNSWANYKAGDSIMTLWGAHSDLAMQPNWRWRFYEQTLLRRTSAPAGLLNQEILERFRERYEKRRPKVLYGYSTILAAFASHMQQHGIRHKPEVIIATAEVLNDSNRRLVESVFGRQVFTHYGSRDTGMISAECSQHEGLHFHPWGCHVEFEPVGETPDGLAYRILITDLLNYGQPFIRYDTGDCAILRPHTCGCGRWFPMASKILGRVSDGIFLADGGMVPGVSVGNHMSQMGQSFHSIAQVQFVQKTHEHIHLRYVVKDRSLLADNELQTICHAIDSLANHRMEWTLEQVADIPRERSGKIRLCVSDIPRADSAVDIPSGTPASEMAPAPAFSR